MYFLAWLTLILIVSGYQLPFQLNQDDTSLKAHYSSVAENLHPVDLSQYASDVVLRAKKTPELLRFLKNERLPIWAQNGAEKTIDFQVPGLAAGPILLKFAFSDAKVLVKDLAQAVYELYPEDYEGNNFSEYSAKSASNFSAFVALLPDSLSSIERVNVVSDMFFKLYRSLETIDMWLNMISETYPDIVVLETIGETYEKRPLRVVHVSVPSEHPEDQKKTVVITGGVHAREWISISTVLYTIYEMLNHYDNNPDLIEELAKLNFLFIPTLNPDGYDYTWTTDRLWRKNRQQISEDPNDPCKGIDIDHSFDYHWTESSDSVCGEDYAGSKPFESLELSSWDAYLNKTNADHKIWGYIDLHSYSQEILYPYAFSCDEKPRDEENLIELGFGISKAFRLQSGKYYSVLPACIDRDSDLLPELGSGSALDYMYHHRSYWAYQIKLRDTGAHGFLLPEKYIQAVGEEVSAGMKYFCRFILDIE